jgi:hypothetical protein
LREIGTLIPLGRIDERHEKRRGSATPPYIFHARRCGGLSPAVGAGLSRDSVKASRREAALTVQSPKAWNFRATNPRVRRGRRRRRLNVAALERSDNVADSDHAFAMLKRGYPRRLVIVQESEMHFLRYARAILCLVFRAAALTRRIGCSCENGPTPNVTYYVSFPLRNAKSRSEHAGAIPGRRNGGLWPSFL